MIFIGFPSSDKLEERYNHLSEAGRFQDELLLLCSHSDGKKYLGKHLSPFLKKEDVELSILHLVTFLQKFFPATSFQRNELVIFLMS